MFEDKLPILFEVFIYFNYYIYSKNLQKAKEKGIKISQIEEIDTDTEEKNEISEFQTLISKAQEHIKNIEKQISLIIPLKNRVNDAMGEEDVEVSKKINSIINKVDDSKNKMDKIIKSLKDQLNPDETNKEQTEVRVKKNLFDSMIKKYQNTLQRFQDEEGEIKKNKETKLIRGAEIALGQDLNEEERKEVIENPQMVQQIYEAKLKQKPDVKLINAVQDLEERHKEIKNLETSILQLHKMVVELNLLVQYQGEMIDNIVDNINSAKEYIKKGEVQVGKAKKNMECTRKIKCIIIIVVIVVLLIILIPILVKVL